MDENESRQGITRRDALRRGAVVGGALVWTAPVVQSLAHPAFAQTAGTEAPQQVCGRLTGGGQGSVVTSPDRQVNYGIGQLFCAAVNYTEPPGPPALVVNYLSTTGQTVTFKLTSYSSTCSGDGERAGSPDAEFNRIDIVGSGTVQGSAATIVATFIDNGEGAGAFAPDQVALDIDASDPRYDLLVPLSDVANGNLQAHRATGNPNISCA